MRGEYALVESGDPLKMELPPRARRIPGEWEVIDTTWGTTSACAENTQPDPLNGICPGNYLRVRGEYRDGLDSIMLSSELPPRARRIHVDLDSRVADDGTTSACAENTSHAPIRKAYLWNYLRVRGEYPK